MPENVTTTLMVLYLKEKVDLECHRCFKKVKKVLCKFPQVRDQKYEEKQNLVVIKVVCCSPEKIRQKLCYKGSHVIKSIEILVPDQKPKEPPDQKKKPPDQENKTDKQPGKKKGPHEPETLPFLPPIVRSVPVSRYPIGSWCGQCSQCYGGCPCFHGHGGPPPPPCYDQVYTSAYGMPVNDTCGYGDDGGAGCSGFFVLVVLFFSFLFIFAKT